MEKGRLMLHSPIPIGSNGPTLRHSGLSEFPIMARLNQICQKFQLPASVSAASHCANDE
jgi:hypothetical protein